MADTVIPHKHDILLGRGHFINNHPGNVLFRSIVDRYKHDFVTARRRRDKRSVVEGIVHEIQNLDPPGRFLTEAVVSDDDRSSNKASINQGGKNGSAEVDDNNNNGESIVDDGMVHPSILAKSWICVEHEKGVAKIMHRLRDKNNEGSGAAVASYESEGAIGKQDNNKNVSSVVNGTSLHLGKKVETMPVDKPKKMPSKMKSRNKPSAQVEQQIDAVELISHTTVKSLETDLIDPCQQSPAEPLCELNDHPREGQDQDCLLAHSEGVVDDFESMMIDMFVGNNDLNGNSIAARGNTAINGNDASDGCRIDNNGSMSIAALGSNGEGKDEFESMIDTIVYNRKNSWHGMHNGDSSTEIGTQVHMQEYSNSDIVNQHMNGQDDDEWGVFLQQLNMNANDPDTQQSNALLQQTQQEEEPREKFGSVNDSSGVGNAVATLSHAQLIRQMENRKCPVANNDARISMKGEDHPIIDQLKPDQDVDLFLRDFSLMHDESNICSSQNQLPKQLQEQPLQQDQSQVQHLGIAPGQGQGQGLQGVTLHQWIQGNIPRGNHLAHQIQKAPTVLQYVKRALPVAKKLVEFLIEAETNDAANPVAQPSIDVDNILIQPRQSSLNDNGAPIIDRVLIMNVGDCYSIDTTMSRLAALGAVLYELFGGEKPVLLKEDPPPTIASIGLDDVNYHVNGTNTSTGANISKINNIDEPRRKKKYPSSSENGHSQCIYRLESLGLPYSICALVRNLLDANYGDLSPDDAYTSFEDVNMDISLMINNPARFLENIPINPVPDLVICNDKLYGREKEIEKLERCFRMYTETKACSGVTIVGEAGVGKSKLSLHASNLCASQGLGGYFLTSKFHQNKDVYPLATIGALFNTFCNFFVRDATPDQLAMADKALESALGPSALFLASVVPSLAKIMPSCVGLSPQGNFIDSAVSMQFHFRELLNVLSSNCIGKPIVFVLDDIHWADAASLMLIGSLLLNNHFGSKSVFMICCYRPDEAKDNYPFQQWLTSIEGCSMDVIQVENMNLDGVNELVSDTLHLSPRITRPLASALHHKTRGNPLFLRRLMDSLNEKGLIYVDLSRPQWGWDLNRVMELKISDDVVMVLINSMQRLPEELQLGLNVASCVGSCLQQPLIGILSTDQNLNLHGILSKLSDGGYMDMDKNGRHFRWSHDKVEQAAYQMMPEQKRKENHMRYGLAICAKSMADGGEEKDDLFFEAVNQINKGGPGVLSDPTQRTTIAALNLKAGRRAIIFSDFNAAFKLFKHGISFLDQANHWENEYTLSLDLFDAIAEAACITNDRASVKLYAKELISKATCFEDTLNCLYAVTKSLRHAEFQESLESTLSLLSKLGEPTLRPLDELPKDMEAVNDILQNTTDESIYSMVRCNEKSFVICQKLYASLLNILHFIQPHLIGAASLRMIELTLRNGMCSISPLAFTYYGETLAAVGKIEAAQRLGGIALKLVEQKDYSRYKASVIATVYLYKWSAEPFQAIAEAHFLGYKAGMQSGDILHGIMNEYLSILTSFIAGNNLSGIREKCRDLVLKVRNNKMGFCIARPSLLHIHAFALDRGLIMLDREQIDGIPGLKQSLEISMKKNYAGPLILDKTLSLARAFLFRQLDEISLDMNLSDEVFARKDPIWPIILYAIFFEALVCFQFARQSKDAAKWIGKGDFLLKKMQGWNEHCRWNFENKVQILEAEKMYLSGQFEEAKVLYIRSVSSARAHKFTHEEAIASELAGMFYYERGLQSKAYTLLKHSAECFQKWGATAVVKRIKADIQRLFCLDLQPLQLMDCKMEHLFASRESTTKKRQDME